MKPIQLGITVPKRSSRCPVRQGTTGITTNHRPLRRGAGLPRLSGQTIVGLLGLALIVMAEVGMLIPKSILAGDKQVNSDVDDNVTVIVTFAGSQQAVIRTLWANSFWTNNALIYGRKGTVALNGCGLPLVVHSPGQAVPDAEAVEWRGLKNCYVPQSTIDSFANESIMDRFVVAWDGVGHGH